MVTVYVYYRVGAADVESALRALGPLGCTVSRRVDDVGELVTVMERYALSDGPTTAWLTQMHARAETALGPLLRGVRHTEVFEDVG